jgi:Family of unknown function (DUF6496)
MPMHGSKSSSAKSRPPLIPDPCVIPPNRRVRHRSGTDVAPISDVGGTHMPEKATVQRARQAKRAGKAPTTQAGEFVREEIHHIREGKHGARSTKQAIAVGLSKARRAGVKLQSPPPSASERTKQSAASAAKAGRKGARKPSARRSRAATRALKREPQSVASSPALARQAKSAARRRPAAARKAAARKAVRTKGPQERRQAARKAARTRQRRRRTSTSA